MTNKRESGEGPGLFEDQEPCLSLATEADGSLVFAADNEHPEAAMRAHRLVTLLKWFPLAATASQRVASPARTERLTLADLALYLWEVSREPHERPLDQQSDADFRAFLSGFDMLPGWFRSPGFLRNDAFLTYVKAQAEFMRTISLDGFDEEQVVRRLKRAGLSERMVGREVHFDEVRHEAFPVRAQAEAADSDGDFAYVRDSLAASEGPISLADVEQLLLNRKRKESGWFRAYIT